MPIGSFKSSTARSLVTTFNPLPSPEGEIIEKGVKTTCFPLFFRSSSFA